MQRSGPHSYRDLIVWGRSMTFVTEVYRLTRRFPRDEIFGLMAQLRRASVSIPSNIAEGHARPRRDYLRFLRIARGSVQETETQLLIAIELGFVTPADCDAALKLADEVNRMLAGLGRATRASRKGTP
ncbi:MAG TPA: four helix bundle protein [Gemmatimonadaceae bacterium]|nr:four helix bundle protein [Gemmatimonadaceae bacterium]